MPKTPAPLDDEFRFTSTDQIGFASAEDDAEFLRTCFVNTGDLQVIDDAEDNRIIVLGRTGSGKSAIFERLKELHPGRVIEIRPDHLALTYVSHSKVLNTFASTGTNLDPFFSLLWRHVITVEILKNYFQSYHQSSPSLWDSVSALFSKQDRDSQEMKEAIAYLRQWGEDFWHETEYRVKDITKKMEVELTETLKAKLGAKFATVEGHMGEVDKLSVEEKVEVQQLGQDVVSKAQVTDLSKVLKMLDIILADRQKYYYLIIDRLDENWVEEKLRYRLIMALIQAAKDFMKVKNAKIVLALRRDLIDRVFRLARQAGFQEEKFVSLYRSLKWNQEQILEVLDLRVKTLVRRRYTKRDVSYKDVLPKTVEQINIDDFIFAIAPRPRDVIAFFNACITNATGQPKLNRNQLSKALAEYSNGRLRALADEWSADFPLLIECATILNGRQAAFKLGTVGHGDVDDLCLSMMSNNPDGSGLLHEGAMGVVDQIVSTGDFIELMFNVFFRTGLVGLKLSADTPYAWVGDSETMPPRHTLHAETGVRVAPSYIRALKVRDAVYG